MTDSIDLGQIPDTIDQVERGEPISAWAKQSLEWYLVALPDGPWADRVTLALAKAEILPEKEEVEAPEGGTEPEEGAEGASPSATKPAAPKPRKRKVAR